MLTIYGKTKTTIEQLRQTPIIPPEGGHGRAWAGMQFGDLANHIVSDIEQRGWELLDSQYSLNSKQTELIAGFDVRMPTLRAPKGIDFALGIVSSNSQRRAVCVYAGGVVKICSNGLVVGKNILKHKHTVNFDWRSDISDAIADFALACRSTGQMIARLQNRKLAIAEVEHIICQAGKTGVMPWSRLGQVFAEYESPSFSEFKKKTSWSLLNAFTAVVKQDPPHRQLDEIDRFRQLLPVNTAI